MIKVTVYIFQILSRVPGKAQAGLIKVMNLNRARSFTNALPKVFNLERYRFESANP